MDNILYSFILTLIAGLSTLLGYFIIYINGNKNNVISFFLSFASGTMIIISIVDLIPSSFKYLSDYYIFLRLLFISLFMIIGFIISNYVNFFINKREDNKLKQLGLLSLLSMVLHNIPEGMITFIVSSSNIRIGLSLSISIALHNIPEGIGIAIPLFYATNNKFKTFLAVLIAGFSELVGGIIIYLFFLPFINGFIIGIMLCIISGIMLNLGLFNLFDEAVKYNKKMAIRGFILGIIIMFIINVFV